MEIYKLKDQIQENSKKERFFDGAEARIFRVTDIRQAVKNENRVNVFVNGKFSFSLDVAQLVDFKIKVGVEISEEEIEKFKQASEFGKLYQRALEKALTRPQSEKEMRDYLNKKVYEKQLDKKYIDEVIERLKDKKYISDRAFAEYYVENRFMKKGISRRRLYMELIKKGIDKEIIEEVLDKRNDEEEILKIIQKKRVKYTDEKLISYLVRQGFSFELARELVHETDLQNLE